MRAKLKTILSRMGRGRSRLNHHDWAEVVCGSTIVGFCLCWASYLAGSGVSQFWPNVLLALAVVVPAMIVGAVLYQVGSDKG